LRRFHQRVLILARPGDDGRPLVSAMEGYWSSFGIAADPNAFAGAVPWPRFDLSDEKHLVLDIPVTVDAHLAAQDCDFWDTMPAPKLVTY